MNPETIGDLATADGNLHAPVHSEQQRAPGGRILDTAGSRATPFVGRRSAVESLVTTWTSEQAVGPCQTVIVSGEAGIGKTTLLEQAARLAPHARLLVGRCLDLGEAPSYAPFVGVMRDLHREGELARARDELPPWVVSALGWLLPEFATPDPPHRGTRTRMFDAFLVLLEHLARSGSIVLVVEDLHWADQSTWDLLLYVIHNAVDLPLTTVVTHRDLPRGHHLRLPLSELERLGHVSHLRLPGLRRADVIVQATALVGTPPTREETDRIMRLTNGNPLYVEAAIHLLESPDAAGGTRDLLLAPVETLPSDCQSVLRVIAVGGTHVQHNAVAVVSGMNPADLERAIRPAVEVGLLVSTTDGYRFRHDLIREAIYHELILPGERVRLHRAYATSITGEPSVAPPAVRHAAGELARHWTAAGEPLRALVATWHAAQDGRNLLAHPERLRMLRNVLELWTLNSDPQRLIGVTRVDVLRDSVEAAEESGEGDVGLALADEVLRDADLHDGVIAAEVLERRSRIRLQLGIGGSCADLDDALRALPQHEHAIRARLLAQLADRLRIEGDLVAARHIADESHGLARQSHDEYSQLRARIALLSASDDKAEEAHLSGLTDARLQAIAVCASPVLAAAASIAEAGALARRARTADSVRIARQGLQHARSAGLESTIGARLAFLLVRELFAEGRWDEANDALVHALEMEPPPGYRARLVSLEGRIALARGDLTVVQQLREDVNELLGTRHHWSDLETDLEVAILDTTAAMAVGDDAAARGIACATFERWRPDTTPPDSWPLLIAAASASRGADRHRTPTSATGVSTDALREFAGRLSTSGPVAQAWAATFAAELADTTQLDEARENELTAWEATRQPWPLGWSLVRSSYSLLAAGRRPLAAQRLRRALSIAELLGATPLRDAALNAAERARLRIDEVAQPVGTRDVQPRTTLTSREIEVLGLLALGRSNRQVGQELFISPKTASIHVSRILMKLGVASRGEAAAEAHRLGLLATD